MSKIPRRPPPPALLASAIPTQVNSSSSSAKPVPLASLLAQSASRSQQLEIILGYWDLAAAVATVQFRKEELAHLQSLPVASADQQAYQTAVRQAEAALQGAETALAQAQQALADKVGWDAKTVRPWPVDKPHIGPYWTQLTRLFSGRPAPRRLQMIDKCLPWWQKTIDRRAEAIYAAQDALEAFTEAYSQRRIDIQPLLWAHARWTEQHTAFLQATLAYNAQIAEFALAVAPSQMQGASLVSMLILSDRSPARPDNRQSEIRRTDWQTQNSPVGQDAGVQAAEYVESVSPTIVPAPQPEPFPSAGSQDSASSEALGRSKQEPTLAPPRKLVVPQSASPLPGGGQEPTPAPAQKTSSSPSSPDAKAPLPSRGQQESSEGFPLRPLAPIPDQKAPSESAGSPPKDSPTTSPSPSAEKAPEKPIPYEAKRPPDTRMVFPEESLALYPALVRATPAVQVKQLALSFHGPMGPTEKVRQETLLACLQRTPPQERREVIDAYWTLWQQWAELAALNQQKDILEELGRMVLQQRNRPLGAEAMLQWRVARLAEEADRIEAHIRLLEREEKLAQYLNVSTEGNLIPATLPHTGSYHLRLEAQPKKLAESWPVRRAAGLIPALYTSLQDQAKTVVLSDQTRTALLHEYRQGQRSLQEVLAVCDQQKQAILDFLQILADYNQAIADYVVLVVPADLPAERFVQTLVR